MPHNVKTAIKSTWKYEKYVGRKKDKVDPPPTFKKNKKIFKKDPY